MLSRCNSNDIDVINDIGTIRTIYFGNFATMQINRNNKKFCFLQNNTNKDHNARAIDTRGARGAMALPLFCKIILFVFSAKHSFSSSRVWILYINNWIHRILNDNKVISYKARFLLFVFIIPKTSKIFFRS